MTLWKFNYCDCNRENAGISLKNKTSNASGVNERALDHAESLASPNMLEVFPTSTAPLLIEIHTSHPPPIACPQAESNKPV